MFITSKLSALSYNDSATALLTATRTKPVVFFFLFAHYHARRGREEKKCKAGNRRKEKGERARVDSHIRPNRGYESQHPVTQWWNCRRAHPQASGSRASIAQFRFIGEGRPGLSSPVIED